MMMYTPPLSKAPDRQETLCGWVWLLTCQLLLPSFFAMVNSLLPKPLSSGMLNFVYYCLNFCVCALIFHRFLLDNLRTAGQRVMGVIWYAVLAYLGYQTITELVSVAIYTLCPDFSNVNDTAIYAMLARDPILTVGIVLLAPITEEILFRGMLFRKLFDWKPVAAYLISMAAFSSIHVTGYIGSASPLVLLLCFVQYLPAGYCLCWCYRRTGTILSPMLMHILVNATSILYFLR